MENCWKRLSRMGLFRFQPSSMIGQRLCGSGEASHRTPPVIQYAPAWHLIVIRDLHLQLKGIVFIHSCLQLLSMTSVYFFP